MRKSTRDMINRCLSIVIFIIVFVGFIFFNQKITSDANNYSKKILLDSGWDFSKNGELTKNVTLSEFKFDMAQKGDNITLSYILPEEKIDHPILGFTLYHCIVDISVDGTKIYKAGYEEAKEHEAVGFGRYTTVLPEDYMGKTLIVKLKVDENEAFPNIDTMWIEDETKYTSTYIYEHVFDIFTAVYLIVIGTITILICIIIGKYTREYRKLLEIGCIALSIGVWTSANGSFIKLLTDNMKIITCCEYLSGYFTLLFIFIFFTETNISKRMKKISSIIILLYSAFIATSIIFEILDIKHVSSFLNYSSAITIVMSVYLLLFMFYGYSKKSTSDKVITKGLVIIVFTGGLDIVKYNLTKYFKFNFGTEYFLIFGISIFLCLMVYAYILYIKEYMSEEAEKKVLCRLAYCDQLTGISNRTKCDEYLQKLDEVENSSYSIVNFDLNNLKYINDTYGHLKGDEYICSFAKILKTCFNGIGIVGRMGGDEFVAIVNSDKSEKISEKITKMLELAEADKISFAYGVADKETNSRLKADEIYEVADKLMYECKKKQKNEKA